VDHARKLLRVGDGGALGIDFDIGADRRGLELPFKLMPSVNDWRKQRYPLTFGRKPIQHLLLLVTKLKPRPSSLRIGRYLTLQPEVRPIDHGAVQCELFARTLERVITIRENQKLGRLIIRAEGACFVQNSARIFVTPIQPVIPEAAVLGEVSAFGYDQR
jgi:hypothetical protein